MEIAVRPAVTAGVALAAAGMIAVTPVSSVVPDVQVPEIQLVGFAGQLQDWMSGLNDFLYHGLLDVNQGLVGAQVGLEQAIAKPFGDLLGPADGILNGIPNRLFNVFNMGLGGAQSSLLGVLGADFVSGGALAGKATADSGITASLLVGLNNATNPVFDTGAIGGLEGMFGQALQAFANMTGFPDKELMIGLEAGMAGFNHELVESLLGMNKGLVVGELGFERLIAPVFEYFPGYVEPTSILNGVVNRGFNTINMSLGSLQQGFLGLLGADFDTAAFADSLLVASNVGPFTDSTIGGLEGVLGNGYMTLANFVGLFFDSDVPGAPLGFLGDVLGNFNPLDYVLAVLGTVF